MSRNTKIVVTYGPAIASPEGLRRVLRAGADVVRLNFSHGELEDHATAVRLIRQVSGELGRHTAILQDLRGPKIRVGRLAEPILLKAGEVVHLSCRLNGLEAGVIPVEGYPTLAQDIQTGQTVLLDDGAIRLEVEEVAGAEVRCRVRVGGTISARKGINFPDTRLKTLQTITSKDWRDLEFGLEQGVDWVALSFVRSARDIQQLSNRIGALGADVPVIAKIEKGEALQALEEIVATADGIMVARGDLGVETDLEEVVLRQKEIIRACNRQGKVVITATQMLESMIAHPTPTRAEVADVSNAIFDGTDALMLSGETAVGAYPSEAVAFMARVADRVEEALDAGHLLAQRPFLPEVSDAVAHAACVTAHEIEAHAMVCLTRSGLTARLVSRYRPRCPVIALSPHETTARRLAVQWGVIPVYLPVDLEGEALVRAALDAARSLGVAAEGDPVVITAGLSSGALRGKTNLIRVELA